MRRPGTAMSATGIRVWKRAQCVTEGIVKRMSALCASFCSTGASWRRACLGDRCGHGDFLLRLVVTEDIAARMRKPC